MPILSVAKNSCPVLVPLRRCPSKKKAMLWRQNKNWAIPHPLMHPEICLFFKAQIKLLIFQYITSYGLPVFIPTCLNACMNFFQGFISHLWNNPLMSHHILNSIKNKSEKSQTLWKSFPSTLVLALVLVENQLRAFKTRFMNQAL